MIKLAEAEHCTGCSACKDICPKEAISMEYNNTGFRYPIINRDECIQCHLCERKCPILNKTELNNPYIKTFAGYSLDSDILLHTTSGGFATQLAEIIIRQGGLVAGVKYASDLIHSKYSLVSDIESIYAFSGSKYVQSEKNGIFLKIKSALKDGRKVLFIGCPCDIAGLMEVIGKSDSTNLLTCELVCMGVSSPDIAKEFNSYILKKYKSPVTRICARSKIRGWFVPTLEIQMANGKSLTKPLYASYLGRGMQVYNRPSCFNCKFRGTNGIGDIRIGDFWGIKKTDEYWNVNGVSCIFIRTEKGLQALNDLRLNKFKLFEVDYSKATENNTSSTYNKAEKYKSLSQDFGKIFYNQGLIAACNATSDFGFKMKRVIPAEIQPFIKRVYHLLRDK